MDHERRKRIEQYEDTVDGARSAMVLMTLLDLKVHAAVRDGWRDLHELAEATGTAEKRLGTFLDVGVTMGFLRKEQGRYGLVPGDEKIFGDVEAAEKLFVLGGLEDSFHCMSQALDILRNDETPNAAGAGAPVTEAHRRRFLLYLHHRSLGVAQETADLLSLEPFTRLVDLGSGAGTYAFALLSRNPEASGVLVDRENSLPLIQDLAREEGLSDRVEAIGADFIDGDYGRGFDLALVSNILHCYGPEVAKRVVVRAAESLAPGGRMAIKDFYIANDLSGPDSGIWFRLTMAMNTPEGDVYTVETIRSWMVQAGLVPEICHALREAPDAFLLIGRKPRA